MYPFHVSNQFLFLGSRVITIITTKRLTHIHWKWQVLIFLALESVSSLRAKNAYMNFIRVPYINKVPPIYLYKVYSGLSFKKDKLE